MKFPMFKERRLQGGPRNYIIEKLTHCSKCA